MNMDQAVQVEMRNVLYHFSDRVAVHIMELEGQLVPIRGELVVFDDPRSFLLSIHSAQISITPDALTNVLNQNVFASPDAPLKDLVTTIEGQTLKVKGKLHSQGDLPFEMESTIRATPEGKIRIEAHKIKAAHLPVKGLMDLLGVKIEELINTRKVRGVRAEKDDVILDPNEIFPPPAISGRLSLVRIEGKRIVQVYGGKPAPHFMGHLAGNYMAYRRNQLRFGKLTMSDSDMVLLDMDPNDPFDFYLEHYQDQLVAGYTKTTPQFGLRVFMRDYNKLSEAEKKH